MARLFFLICFICTSCLVTGQKLEYALSGKNHSLRPHVPGRPTAILWRHNRNKVVEFDGFEEQVFGSFENRINLDRITADLEIRNLTFEDSGRYELEVEMNLNFLRLQYSLKVIDKVAVPTISCKIDEGRRSSGSGNQATLLCSTKSRSSQSSVEFEWKSQGKVHTGQRLQITLGGQHDDEEHTCLVKNRLSSEAATFTAKECYPDNSPSVGLIIGLVVSVVIAVLLVIIALYLRHKKQACFAKGDVENQAHRKGRSDSADNHKENTEPGTAFIKKVVEEFERKHKEEQQPLLRKHKESENKLDEGQGASPVKAAPEASPAGQPPSSPTKSSLDTEAKKTDVEQEKDSVSEQEKTTDEDENATSDQDGSSSPLEKGGPGRDSDSPAEETNEELHTPGTGKDKAQPEDNRRPDEAPASPSPLLDSGLTPAKDNILSDRDVSHRHDNGSELNAGKGQVQMNIDKFNRQSQRQTHHGQSPPTKVPASISKKGPLPAPSSPVGASPSLEDLSGNPDIQKGDADEDKLRESMDEKITKCDLSDSEEGKKQNTDSVQSDGEKDDSAPEDPEYDLNEMPQEGIVKKRREEIEKRGEEDAQPLLKTCLAFEGKEITVPPPPDSPASLQDQSHIPDIQKHDAVEEVKDKIRDSTNEKLPQSDHSDSQEEGNKQNTDLNQSNEEPVCISESENQQDEGKTPSR